MYVRGVLFRILYVAPLSLLLCPLLLFWLLAAFTSCVMYVCLYTRGVFFRVVFCPSFTAAVLLLLLYDVCIYTRGVFFRVVLCPSLTALAVVVICHPLAVGQDGGGRPPDHALQRASVPVQVPRVSNIPPPTYTHHTFGTPQQTWLSCDTRI